MKNIYKNLKSNLIGLILILALVVGAWFYVASLMENTDKIKLDGRAAFSLNLPALYNKPLVIKLFGVELAIAPLGAREAQAEINGNVVKYIDAFANTDVVQTRYFNKIKEDIILKSPGHPEIFGYQIDLKPYDFIKDSSGNLIFYEKGHSRDEAYKRFAIPAPFLIGADGKKSSTSEVAFELGKNGRLTLKPNAQWLAKAKYPVILDPTIEINVLNVHSSPQQGENWTVNFTTQGQADLKIIPNDRATINDDEFVSLSCGTEKRQPQILSGDVIYYPNWFCETTASVVHYTKKAGNHTLRFEFGGQIAYAYNSATFYATGGTITESGGYRIHTFTSSGTAWNPSDKNAGIVLGNNNLTATHSISGWTSARATESKSSGKWYWEITINAGIGYAMEGVANSSASLDNYIGADANGWSYDPSTSGSGKYHDGYAGAYGADGVNGDVIGVALDMDAGTMTFYKNGVSLGQAFTGITGSVYPAISLNGTTPSVTANFGATAFAYTPPDGYSAFNTPSVFTVTGSGNVEVLVVGGGGGGSYAQGGGGGGGKVTYNSSFAVTAGNISVTVGGGGSGGVLGATLGVTGESSVFSSITSTGGLGGGTNLDGGASGNGYAGGTTYGQGVEPYKVLGGGGGGAGAVGASPASGDTVAGNGGAGISNSISGSSVYYGGGGGGGTYITTATNLTGGSGGNGGGGHGGGSTPRTGTTDGTANTGGGGGAGSQNPSIGNGGAGGSGIVIVRYIPVYSAIVFRSASDQYTKLLIHADEVSGSTALADSASVPKTITAYGNASTTSAQGKFGNSAAFDGAGDYLSVPANTDFNFGSGDFTIDMWININTLTDYVILYDHITTNPYYGWRVALTSAGVPYLNILYNGSAVVDITSSSALIAGVWQHLAAVKNGNVYSIYIDGVQKATATYSSTLPSAQQIVYIGKSSIANQYYMNGYIDEFRVSKGIARWTANFTPPTGPYANPVTGQPIVFRSAATDQYTKLLIHANEAGGSTALIDSESIPKTITAYGNASTTSATGKFGNSAAFDGTGDSLRLADSDDFEFGSGDFTIDFWYKATGAAANLGIFSRKSVTGIGATGNNVAIMDDGTNIAVYLYGSDNNLILNAASFGARSTTDFIHYALVRNGSNWRTYRNGSYVTEVTSSFAVQDSDATSVSIGEYANQDLHGYLDEFRISKGIARWTANFTPPTAPYASTGSPIIFK